MALIKSNSIFIGLGILQQLTFPFSCQDFQSFQSTKKCNPTTRDVEGPFFETGASNTAVIAPTGELTPNTMITVQGQVLDTNCKPLAGAIVNVWHAGGNPVGYTFNPDVLWYRGFRVTDQNGSYNYTTTYPGTYSGRPIPHVHYKVITSRKELVTQLYFKNDVPRSYEDYVVGRSSQFPSQIRDLGNSGKYVNFDIVI